MEYIFGLRNERVRKKYIHRNQVNITILCDACRELILQLSNKNMQILMDLETKSTICLEDIYSYLNLCKIRNF